jgi:hypothetical protein
LEVLFGVARRSLPRRSSSTSDDDVTVNGDGRAIDKSIAMNDHDIVVDSSSCPVTVIRRHLI